MELDPHLKQIEVEQQMELLQDVELQDQLTLVVVAVLELKVIVRAL